MTERIKLTGGAVLIRLLAAAGVREAYGVASGKMMPLIRAIAAESRIRYVGTRHEASAALMGAAVFAGTGRPALCLGETGPGGLNLLSSLGVAYNNNLALIAVTSNHASRLLQPFRGAFSELDTEQAFRPVTKWNVVARETGRLPEVVRAALRAALTGRPGPVHIDIPTDVLAAEAEFDTAELDAPIESYRPVGRPQADADLVREAAALLAAAERPLLIAGGGVVAGDATNEFRALAERIGGLALATQMGLGSVSSASPRFIGQGGIIGGAASLQALREADVLLAVGCRFSSWMWTDGPPAWNARPDQKIIQIDIDPAMIGRNAPVAIGLQADARTALRQIEEELGNRQGNVSADWIKAVLATHRDFSAKLDGAAASADAVMHPAALAREAGAFIGSEGRVVFDGGHTSFWSNWFTPTTKPRCRFHDPGMAQLGFGVPYAHALKHCFPDEPVFNITGDGAFGFTLQELDTARRHGLPVIHIVHNNAALGVIRFAQQNFGKFEFGTDLSGTDYAAIARGFGCHGERVTRVEEVRPALARAVASGKPAVIDALVSFQPHPALPTFGKSTAA